MFWVGQDRQPAVQSFFFVEVVNACRGEKKRHVTLFLCAEAMWTWKTRNDAVFNNKVLTSLVAIINKMLM
jgi:hypothetical protein